MRSPHAAMFCTLPLPHVHHIELGWPRQRKVSETGHRLAPWSCEVNMENNFPIFHIFFHYLNARARRELPDFPSRGAKHMIPMGLSPCQS